MKYYKSFDRDPSLPDPGSSPFGPKLITREAHEAIVASDDLHALAMLRGYLSSYLGPAGGMLIATAGIVFTVYSGEVGWAFGFGVALLVSVMTVMQVRRRARQWTSIVQARMDQLIAQETAGTMSNSMRVGGSFAPTGLSLSLFGRETRQ